MKRFQSAKWFFNNIKTSVQCAFKTTIQRVLECEPCCVSVWSDRRTISLFDGTQSNYPVALQPLKQLLASPPFGKTVVEQDIGGLMFLLRVDSVAYGFLFLCSEKRRQRRWSYSDGQT